MICWGIFGGFQKNGGLFSGVRVVRIIVGPVLGFLVIRIMVYWGLLWGLPNS